MGSKIWGRISLFQNIFFIAIAIVYSVFLFSVLKNGMEISTMFLLGSLIYIIGHGLRICRLYIIFLGRKFPFFEILRVYLSTSWVNFIIPFKLGEINRVIEFSRLCNSFKMGFVSLWIERFFDSFILITLFFIVSLTSSSSMSFIVVTLILFSAFSLFSFYAFPSSYRYFNTLLLSESSSYRGLRFLSLLNSLKEYYDYARKLLHGRFAIIFMISLIIWISEFTVFTIALDPLFKHIDITNIHYLLNEMWGFSGDQEALTYKSIVYVVLGVCTVVVFAIKLYLSVKSTLDFKQTGPIPTKVTKL